ncbi:hypothetical protein [Leptospira bouyouniensis]|uniref:Lipoprotein LipL21 n=1 Tax=Leptospira bouyouniensis TaxID=2484911 RepID=A0ABY2L9Q3_9LEPT|nr:hypothetical protein [Leptospira bouyouniensis]TGK54249.1 hypothetical protein EHQ10_00345 [Leptospira bouyouniensis]
MYKKSCILGALIFLTGLAQCVTIKKMVGKVSGTSYLNLNETIEESMERPAIFEEDIYWQGKKVGKAKFLAAAKGFASLKDAFNAEKRKLTEIYETASFKAFPQTYNSISVPACNEKEKEREEKSMFYQGIAALDLNGKEKFTIGEISRPDGVSCSDCSTEDDKKKGISKQCANVKNTQFTIFYNFENNQVYLGEADESIKSLSAGLNYEESWSEKARDWIVWNGKPAIEMLKADTSPSMQQAPKK